MDRQYIESMAAEEGLELVLKFDGTGRILFANRSAREKLGYTEEELPACSMTRVFRQEFQQEDGEFSSFDAGSLMEKKETVMYRKNSMCFPVALRFFPLEDGNFCLLAEDITQRKATDARLEQLKEEGELNQRLRNEFTANVTHELRTPVNGIKGHVLTLLDTTLTEEQRKTLEIVLYCCENMYSIISNILDFSKLEAGKFTIEEKEFDFYKMMDYVISTHTAEINRKELHLSLYVDDRIPQYLVGDSLRIGQILNNLLSNAVKFTLLGQVSVDVNMTLQVGDEVELFFMVRDSGIGMTKEEQDKLFKSFNQVDASISRRFGGTGLGLAITKQLVEMMNGSIHVESEKGKGSCFSFSIKVHTGQNEGTGSAQSEAYKKLAAMTAGMEKDSGERFFEFGSEDNVAELNKRMEKLVLSIELGSWDRAETLAETVKALTENAGADLKRLVLKMEMAIRKENYEKSIAAYEQLKTALADGIKPADVPPEGTGQ